MLLRYGYLCLFCFVLFLFFPHLSLGFFIKSVSGQFCLKLTYFLTLKLPLAAHWICSPACVPNFSLFPKRPDLLFLFLSRGEGTQEGASKVCIKRSGNSSDPSRVAMTTGWAGSKQCVSRWFQLAQKAKGARGPECGFNENTWNIMKKKNRNHQKYYWW